MSVTNLDNPYGSPGIRPFSCCTGGVQEIEFGTEPPGRVVSKLKPRGNRPLLDVTSEHFELRAGSGLQAEIPIDVGVRDGAKNGVDVEKAPKMAGDVPVRYALVGPGPAPAFSPTCSLSYSRAVCCVDTDVDADSRLDVLSRLFTHTLSPVVCDCVSVSSWAISFTSHVLG